MGPMRSIGSSQEVPPGHRQPPRVADSATPAHASTAASAAAVAAQLPPDTQHNSGINTIAIVAPNHVNTAQHELKEQQLSSSLQHTIGSSSSNSSCVSIGSSNNSSSSSCSSISSSGATTVTVSNSSRDREREPSSANFEYDDNEWDIGIGDLIIDLDADIEKTNEHQQQASNAVTLVHAAQMAANTGQGAQASKAAATAKMHIEHSATADKGLKMKIKRTKPGTKTSEAKHEIVKSNEQNGSAEQPEGGKGAATPGKHGAQNVNTASPAAQNSSNSGNSKRGSSGHRRDKARDKHSSSTNNTGGDQKSSAQNPKGGGNNPSGSQQQQSGAVTVNVSEMNGLVRVSAPQVPPRTVFPASTGPGPPQSSVTGPSPGPPQSPASGVTQTGSIKTEQNKTVNANASSQMPTAQHHTDDGGSSPPPSKKIKTEPKDTSDVCVGTSVGTITEPDCLGPCEPGTSVTLEGIVWHETEGGVLVVNVTWRGKTYVGTLLDCTRHDWAPPRFCDSPTSDLDNRTPKGRETRSSVHSKLRNGGGGAKGRRNGSGQQAAPASPTPFIPPRPEPTNKRKSRVGEEEAPQQNANVPAGKKTKVIVPPVLPIPANPTPCSSPPPSPVLLECPEPNCSKKYKHINGLKYHQSHAHGSVAEDDDTKDVTSMSENDESNIEAPSPATPVKSPEKAENSPITPQKKDEILLRNPLLDVPSQPPTPRSTPPSPATPQSVQDLGQSAAGSPTVPPIESKNVVKPGVLRYTEEYQVGVFPGNKPQIPGSPLTNSGPIGGTIRSATSILPPSEQGPIVVGQTENVAAVPQQQQQPPQPPQSFSSQLQSQVNMPSQQFTQPPTLIIPNQSTQNPPQSPQSPTKMTTQFKVKSTASLMPDDKNKQQATLQSVNGNNPNVVNTPGSKVQSFKKKNRSKSPAGSPLPSSDQQVFGMEQTASGRDEVQSPAYSDISDDGAPVVENEDKSKITDKKTESGSLPHMPNYGMYQFYGQPHQYLVPQSQQEGKQKEADKQGEKAVIDVKDGKEKGSSDYPQKVLPQHYYQYGYMAGYPSYMDPNYGSVPMVQEEKLKEERVKESPSPIDQTVKQPTPIPNVIQVPTPGKVKTESNIKEKHQNENHQILKESIEIKNQMNPYLYSRQPQQQTHQQSQHQQREEDVRRFYVYNDQRRKEQQSMPEQHKSSTPSKSSIPQSPSVKLKEPKLEEKKEKDIKQEGVKPTMETQGPPPPPTSQYAYIHPSYMQSAHYGALPFDPNHPMYRGIMVPGPYSNSPYLHPQIPRYHAPEDLSRAQPGSKALDMLQHHAQYYSSHKIHELQERAIKSPTPKTSVASSSPSTNTGGPPPGQPPAQMNAPATSQPSGATPTSGKQTPGDNKDSRSPPPQRHVHTHHHTHVGLGYPMYPAPYGAAVLASQQAAAVTVINPYPTK